MVFDRGSKSDYDGWEVLGNKGWNWEELLPYFKKACKRIHMRLPMADLFPEREIYRSHQKHQG